MVAVPDYPGSLPAADMVQVTLGADVRTDGTFGAVNNLYE